MKKDVYNKTFVISIVILFIGISVIPSSGTQIDNNTIIPTNLGNTLYVGGSGGGNYSTIQSAINDANSGDTVFVYDDSSPYNEWDILINKSINLIGEDKDTTVIDAKFKGSVVIIQSDGVTVSGFTLKNCNDKSVLQYNVITIVSSENIVIEDNIILLGYKEYNADHAGVLLESSSNSLIQNNFINGEDAQSSIGVMIYNDADLNNVSGNEIIATSFGIVINSWPGYGNCDDNILYGNNIHNNNCGIEIQDDNNEIINNIVTDNEYNGIGVTSHNITISGNTITDNCDGMFFHAGIRLRGSHDTRVTNNYISNNNPYGIDITGSNSDDASQRNYISGNHISNNEVYGISIDGSWDNIITQNNIIGHTRNAYFERVTPWVWKAKNEWEGNYWSGIFGGGIFPKIISGNGILIFGYILIPFPWVEIDWHPARKPYDI